MNYSDYDIIQEEVETLKEIREVSKKLLVKKITYAINKDGADIDKLTNKADALSEIGGDFKLKKKIKCCSKVWCFRCIFYFLY